MKYWTDIPELRNRAVLAELVNTYWSASNIAAHLGCSVNSVRSALRFQCLPVVPVSKRVMPAETAKTAEGGNNE